MEGKSGIPVVEGGPHEDATEPGHQTVVPKVWKEESPIAASIGGVPARISHGNSSWDDVEGEGVIE